METTTMEGHHHRKFKGVTERETGEIGNGAGWVAWPAAMLTWGFGEVGRNLNNKAWQFGFTLDGSHC